MSEIKGEYFTIVYPPTGDILQLCRTADGSVLARVDQSFCDAFGHKDIEEFRDKVWREHHVEVTEWLLVIPGTTINFQLN